MWQFKIKSLGTQLGALTLREPLLSWGTGCGKRLRNFGGVVNQCNNTSDPSQHIRGSWTDKHSVCLVGTQGTCAWVMLEGRRSIVIWPGKLADMFHGWEILAKSFGIHYFVNVIDPWRWLKEFCCGCDFVVLKWLFLSLHIWILHVSFNIDRGDNRWVCVGMDSVSEHTAMICCIEINRKWLLLFCHLWRAHQFQWSTVQCNPQLCHHSKHCIYQVRKIMKEKWARNITLSFIFSSATQSKLWV